MSNRTFSDTQTNTVTPARDLRGYAVSSAAGHTLVAYGDGGIWDVTASAPVGDQSSDLVYTAPSTKAS